MRANGFDWNSLTSAARGGHFLVLQWARAFRCNPGKGSHSKHIDGLKQ
jgi:hypothetical protein